MNTKTVPFDYAVLWLQTSMKIIERYYSLFLACVMTTFIVSSGLTFLPWVGRIISSILFFLFLVGLFKITQRIFNGENPTFDIFLEDTFNTKMFQDLLPMIAVTVLTDRSNVIAFQIPSGLQGLISIIFSIAHFLSLYAAFIKLNSMLDWQSCYVKAAEGLWKNIVTALAGGFIFCFFLVGCTILFVIPLFAYGLPVAGPWNFLVFSCIFNDMDLELVYRAWSQKVAPPQIEPIPTQDTRPTNPEGTP